MKIINKDGFLFRLKPLKEDEEEENENIILVDGKHFHVLPLVDYVYGFSVRRGQKCPTLTVAIVPFIDANADSELYFGVGVAYCSVQDAPVKSRGRSIATSRAKSVLEVQYDLMMKPYAREEGPVAQQQAFVNPLPVAMCVHHLDALMAVRSFYFSPPMLERVTKCLDYMLDLIPETVELAVT